MTPHTVTAMYSTRQDAETAAAAIRQDTAIGATNVQILPEQDDGTTTTGTASHESGFLASLSNFFMPDEDRYGYAEGMRRGDYLVAVDTDDVHADRVMDVLEQHGAIDMDTEETRWRSEGWRGWHGNEPSSAATASSGATTGGTYIPQAAETRLSGADVTGTGVTGGVGTTGTTEPSETIPLAEETLRVGKRQINTGRVGVRTYVVETPVNETVLLREEHVEVERRPVDRPVTADEDLFREREIEVTTSREEPVVSKDARVREEVVVHKSAEEREETVRDTVRRTEVREDRGEKDDVDSNGTVRNSRPL